MARDRASHCRSGLLEDTHRSLLWLKATRGHLKRTFDEDTTDTEATEMARRIMILYLLLSKPLPDEQTEMGLQKE